MEAKVDEMTLYGQIVPGAFKTIKGYQSTGTDWTNPYTFPSIIPLGNGAHVKKRKISNDRSKLPNHSAVLIPNTVCVPLSQHVACIKNTKWHTSIRPAVDG